MTLAELENLMGRAGLTQHQTRELLPAIHAYATTQASAAIDLVDAAPPCPSCGSHLAYSHNDGCRAGRDTPVWHALTLTPEVGSRCGAVGVNTTSTRLVNCPDCLKAGSG